MADEGYDPRRAIPIYQAGIEGVSYYVDPESGRMFLPDERRYLANVNVREIAAATPGLFSLTPDMNTPYTGQELTQDVLSSLMGIGDTETESQAPADAPELNVTEPTSVEAPGFIDMTPFIDQQEVRRAQEFAARIRDEIRQMSEDPTFIGTIGDNGLGSRDEAERRLEEALSLVQQRMQQLSRGSIPSRAEYVEAGLNARGLPLYPSTSEQAEYDNVRVQLRREWNDLYADTHASDGTPK